MKPDEVFSKERQDRKVKAKILLCFLGSEGVGNTRDSTGEASTHEPAGVSYAVKRGGGIVGDRNLQMRTCLLNYKCPGNGLHIKNISIVTYRKG
jgi:hypothetical protein